MEKFLKAIHFANQAHKNQRRKGNKLPYIEHPFAVGMILKEYGYEDEMVLAGFLHDTIEDTKTTYEEILRVFGEKVASYVQAVTEPDKNLSWEKRKQHTINYLKEAPMEVKMIKCADKYHNLYTISEDLKTNGEKVWKAFSAGKEKQEWYAREAYQNLMINLNPDVHPLTQKLKGLIDQLFK